MKSLLSKTDPMGIYQMLYAFKESSGQYMGDLGTHPWSQGFPLTTQLPGGPEMPSQVSLSSEELRYPKPWGHDSLRTRIAGYYNATYGSNLAPENIMITAGGRGALLAVLFLLRKDAEVLVEETEYTLYYDLLKILGCKYNVVKSNIENGFLPTATDYSSVTPPGAHLRLRSNPCNPTGQTLEGAKLLDFVAKCSGSDQGALIDEAYEFFLSPDPVSAIRYVKDIDDTNLFIAGAATKGLQAPGIRLGWVVASRENIATLSNYSTFAMGGVSRLSQKYGEELLEPRRVAHARSAVANFYNEQRERYGEALQNLGIKLFTGRGGFYHWGQLPNGLDADEFNERLFKAKAAILPGRLCDMRRRGADSPFKSFFRFSFGPLNKESFEDDVRILREALD